MKKYQIFLLFNFSFFAMAQKEANIWYFGQNAGLDFSSGTPQYLLDGQLNTIEGCATISTPEGELLFYTDGVTVWNKNHQVMLNGENLLGHASSSQSAVIVPKPGSSTIYYIITIPEKGNAVGARYSVVDMSLGSGLGGITNVKNILLKHPSARKLRW